MLVSGIQQSYYFFWPHLTACGILVPRPGIEPGAMAVKAPNPNHWTTREVPKDILFRILFHSGLLQDSDYICATQ